MANFPANNLNLGKNVEISLHCEISINKKEKNTIIIKTQIIVKNHSEGHPKQTVAIAATRWAVFL